MIGAVLTGKEIQRLLEATPPLVEDYLDLGTQLQVHGFDLTLREVASFCSIGAIGASAEDRVLPQTEALPFAATGWLTLPAGSYRITFNEVVNMPLTLMALGRPRSTLIRSGVTIHSAVWEAGYRGRSQALMIVSNPHGYRVGHNARLMQLVFFRLAEALDRGYSGRYQDEGKPKHSV